jgi:major membrane immunogen (membrane-anchored lipoprotein)
MKKALVIMSLLLTGCGVKDQSFYDLKSPCVSINDGSIVDPCIRTSPILNEMIINS